MFSLDKFPELLQRKELQFDYKETFSTPAGLRVLKNLLINCHVLEPTFTNPKHDPDGRLAAFREGERNVANRILKLMNWNVSDFEKLAKEVENDARSQFQLEPTGR